jgi:predicted short-subunit dehydrogenase-like oxidoreductase (DUF2520 family)
LKTIEMIVVSPGRAGGALALAAEVAGHRIVGVVSRSGVFTGRFPQLSDGADLPAADLLVIATPDSHIEPTAERLAPVSPRIGAAVHMSGFKSIEALAPFGRLGIATGSFHPLQSLSDPETGARSLAGAWAGLTATEPLFGTLTELAVSLEMIPFRLRDADKPLYHAAAAAASNYVIAALDLAGALVASASVPFEALVPLVRTAVDNAFSLGPKAALTGPIARGDWDTVRGQFEALASALPDRTKQFRLMAEATAITAGTTLPQDLHD